MKRTLRSQRSCNVKSARQNEPSVQNTANGGTILLLELNDYCLLKILSLLSLDDLCAVKDTCHKLSLLAHSDAKRICKNAQIRIAYGNKMDALAIKKFGIHMNDVFYQKNQLHRNDALLLSKNTEMRPLMAWYKSFAWMKNCSTLQTLSMEKINVRWLDPAYVNNFENLIKLKIGSCSGDVNNFALIVKACTNLKFIEMADVPSETIGSFRFLLNIEEIRFRTSTVNFGAGIIENDIARLGQQRSLRFLSLVFKLEPFSPWRPPNLIANKFKVVKRDQWSCSAFSVNKSSGVSCMRLCDVTVTL